MMNMLNALKKKIYKIYKPRVRAQYQFGSPIVGLYRWEDYLVVATKLDVYITEDGVNYVRASRDV